MSDKTPIKQRFLNHFVIKFNFLQVCWYQQYYQQSLFRASSIGSRTDEMHLNKNLKLYYVKITTQRLG